MALTLSLYDAANATPRRLDAESTARVAAALPAIERELVKWSGISGQGHLPREERQGTVILIDVELVQAAEALSAKEPT